MSLFKKVPFDPIVDFAPIARISIFPAVLVVHQSIPVSTVAELITYAKARPGQLDRAAGLDPLGWAAQAHTTQQVMDVRPQDGYDMALALGRRAFKENPGADGLLLAGGNWLSNAAIPVLEEEFGRPVITNPAASYWAFMRQLGRCSPRRGFGMLIDSLQT